MLLPTPKRSFRGGLESNQGLGSRIAFAKNLLNKYSEVCSGIVTLRPSVLVMSASNELTPEDQELIKDLFYQLASDQAKFKLTYQQVIDYKKLKALYEEKGFKKQEELLKLQQVAANLKTEKPYPIANIRENLKNRIPKIDALTPDRLFHIMESLTTEKVAEILEPGALKLSKYADIVLEEYRKTTSVDSLKTRMRNFLTKSTLDDFKKASPVERVQYLMLCYILDEAYRLSQEQ